MRTAISHSPTVSRIAGCSERTQLALATARDGPPSVVRSAPDTARARLHAIETVGDERLRAHGRGSGMRRVQVAGLRVVRFLPPEASALVGLARGQKPAQALGPAERIEFVEQLEHRLRPQIERRMREQVIARDQARERRVLGRYF